MEFKIKTFLKAKTAEELERKMLENSIRLKAFVPYQIVFANGWFAWYEISADQLLVDKINAIDKRKG